MVDYSQTLAERTLPDVEVPIPASGNQLVSENRYRKLIHFMPTALWQVDARAVGEIFGRLKSDGVTDIAGYLDGHPDLVELANDLVLVTEVNRAAVTLFRARSAAELLKPVRYLFAASMETGKRVMIAHFQGQRNFSEETKITTLDGQMRDVQLSVTFPTPPEQQDMTFITLSDITDRLRIEAQLRQLQSDHAHAARISTLGELATSIAHEVRQPLSAIVTNGETSLRWLSKEDPNVEKAKQLTARMVASAHRASDILQRIRSMVVKGETQHVALDLPSVLEETLLFVQHDIQSKSIDLSITAEPELPKITGDRIQLQQVIINLLVNSIQAVSPTDHGQAQIDIDVGATENRSQIAFSIRDNGPGIANDHLDQVFESFFTTKKGGMGIGLAICQSIINAHGGHLTVSNHSQGGAHFRFCLPATP